MDGGAAYDALDALYDAWCAKVEEDIPFYLGLAAALADEQGVDALDIIELGAGSGRVTVPLAAAGHRVHAIDASERQLARLAVRADDLGAREQITIEHADMRALANSAPASSAHLVLAPFRALLHVTGDRDLVFAQVCEALRPGGAFAFDVFHARPLGPAAGDGEWVHRRKDPTATGNWRFEERATYRPTPAGDPPDESLLDVDVRCTWRPRTRARRRPDPSLPPDPPAGQHVALATLHLRLATPEAWATSLHAAGFELDAVYGWFDARPLHPDDDDSVWVARRA